MKIVHIIVFFICIVNNVFAQKKFDFDTTVVVGKEKQIYNPRYIKIDGNSSKFVIGFFKGDLTIDTFSISTLASITNNLYANAQGIFIAKYDSNNNFKWLKKMAEADTLFDINIEIDHSNNLVVNYMFLTKLYISNDSLPCNGSSCINLVKYDNEGGIIFKQLYNGNGFEAIGKNGLTIDESNNIFASVNFGRTGFNNYQFNIGNDTLSANELDPAIFKTDTMGNVIKAFKFGGQGLQGFENLVYHSGNLYVIGVTNSNSIELNNLTLNYPANYESKCFLAKLDTNGYSLWIRRFGSQYQQGFIGNSSAKDLTLRDNQLYFTGQGYHQYQIMFLFDGGPVLTELFKDDGSYVICYDTTGAFRWNKLLNDENIDGISQLLIDSSKNVLCIGGSETSLKLLSYDSVGNHNWTVSSGANTFCYTVGSGIANDTKSKIYITGSTTCSAGVFIGNDTLYPPANQSTMFFASLDSIDALWPLGNVEFLMLNDELKVYPNPAFNNVNIKIPNSKIQSCNLETKLELFNTLGQSVYSSHISSLTSNTSDKSHIKIDISTYPNGLYFLSYKNNQQAITKKIIIQH